MNDSMPVNFDGDALQHGCLDHLAEKDFSDENMIHSYFTNTFYFSYSNWIR